MSRRPVSQAGATYNQGRLYNNTKQILGSYTSYLKNAAMKYVKVYGYYLVYLPSTHEAERSYPLNRKLCNNP